MYNIEEHMKELMDESIRANQLVGANVLLIRDGKEKFFGSYGYSDREKGIEMKRNSVFRMFSMSKVVTAAAVMILVERGKLDVKDPVEKFLPGFKNQKVQTADGKTEPVSRPVTVQDLLNMTSGVAYPGIEDYAHCEVDRTLNEFMDEMLGLGVTSTIELCNRLGQCPLAFQPGTQWQYGFSADILGGVIEAVTGMTFGEFLKSEIFEPLGMSETGFVPTSDMRERLTQAYETDISTGELVPYTGMNLGIKDYPDTPAFESGGAGLLSTIDDYAKFAMMLANGGTYNGVRILGKNTARYMRENQLTDEQLKYLDWESLMGYGYGNLVRILENPAKAGTNAPAGEFGWDGWMGTYVTIEPKDKTVILFMIQRINTGTTDVTRKVRQIAYGLFD